MPINPRGAVIPQNIHGLLGSIRLGPDKDELAVVIKRRGVSLDHLFGQTVVGEMGFKGPDNGVQVRLRRRMDFFRAAPNTGG
jgi:hypothetical protein